MPKPWTRSKKLRRACGGNPRETRTRHTGRGLVSRRDAGGPKEQAHLSLGQERFTPRAHPNSTARKTSGSSCVRIGCQTGFSNPSTISSTTAAPLGTHSSTSPGRLCPSRDATGQQSVTQSEDWYKWVGSPTTTPPEWACKGRCPGGVSGTLTGVLGGLPPGKQPGRGECSSRNVRHEQPVGQALLEVPDHAGLGSWDRDRERLTCGRSELDNVGPVVFRAEDHNAV